MNEFQRPQSFDFGAATLQGFNLPSGKGYLLRVVLCSALILTVLYALLGTPIIKAYVAFFTNMFEMEHSLDGSEPDPAVILAAMRPMIQASGMIFLLSLMQICVFASAETAIYRDILYKEDHGIFPLRMGYDEWRVLGTRIVVGIIIGGVYFALYIAAVLIGLVFFGLAAAIDSGVLAGLGGLVLFAGVLSGIAALIWVAVRLAPSSAYSVRDREFNPVASWRSMQGRVWPAIGCYLILYIIGYFAVTLVMSVVFFVLFFASGIIGAFSQMDVGSDELPDFTPVMDHVTSIGFIIPAFLAVFALLVLIIAWYSMIWSMWGYFARTDEGKRIG